MNIFKKRKRERVRREIAEAIEGDPFFDEIKRHLREYGDVNIEEFNNFRWKRNQRDSNGNIESISAEENREQ